MCVAFRFAPGPAWEGGARPASTPGVDTEVLRMAARGLNPAVLAFLGKLGVGSGSQTYSSSLSSSVLSHHRRTWQSLA